MGGWVGLDGVLGSKPMGLRRCVMTHGFPHLQILDSQTKAADTCHLYPLAQEVSCTRVSVAFVTKTEEMDKMDNNNDNNNDNKDDNTEYDNDNDDNKDGGEPPKKIPRRYMPEPKTMREAAADFALDCMMNKAFLEAYICRRD